MRNFDNFTLKILESLKIQTNLFSGTMKNLIDFSNLFSFCNLMYQPTELDMDQELIESSPYTLVVTEKTNIALKYRNRTNFFFLCTEPHEDFYYISNNVLVDVFDKYFELHIPMTTKLAISNMDLKESVFSLMFKIHANAGKFSDHLALKNSPTFDVVPFFFQKYYEYRNKNKVFANLCEVFYKNFRVTGNKYLISYFMLIENMYKI
jgi:hypothetical protein